MRVLPLFPTPIASFSDFITEKERLKLLKEVSAREHQPHAALNGDGVSTHSSVNTTNGVNGYHQTRLTCNANTGGIMTSYAGQANTGGTLYSSARIAYKSGGNPGGGLHIIQVQTTGEA